MSNDDNNYGVELEDLRKSFRSGSIEPIKTEQELKTDPNDEENERLKRSREITKLLRNYTKGYEEKRKSNKRYKSIIFYLSCVILAAFSSVFLWFLHKTGKGTGDVSTQDLVELISICITFLSLIVSVLIVIVKYVFPENEEQYITRIVELIQNNDLENRKETNKYTNAKQEQEQEQEDKTS